MLTRQSPSTEKANRAWDEISNFSDRLVAEALHFSERLAGECSPEEAMHIVMELEELIRLTKAEVIEVQ